MQQRSQFKYAIKKDNFGLDKLCSGTNFIWNDLKRA